jgi:hypothetical protein
MRRTTFAADDDTDIPVTMRLRDDAPRSIIALVRRMALADPEADAQFIKETLESAGVRQISLMTIRLTMQDLRNTVAFLRDEGLLRSDFKERCERIVPDVIPIKRKRTR